MGQKVVHGLDLLICTGAGEHLAGALDEELGLAARFADGGFVGIDSALADEAVGVEAAVEGDDLDCEALFREQGDGFFGGVGAGGVGVEVDDDVGGVAAQHGDLLLGEGGSAGGDDVLNAAKEDGDAVHLAFDEEGKLHLADGGTRLVEVEEDLAFRVEGRLRRVDVLGAGLIAGFERARGEGDDAAALVGDGEHDALAEAVVDVALGAVALLLRTEKAARAQGFVVCHAFEAVAQGAKAVGRVTDAEFGDAFGGESTTGEVLTGDGAFGAAQLFLEKGGGGFVEFEEFGALAGSGGFFGGRELAFGEGNADLLSNDADGFGEADVLDFGDEAEDVARGLAAEAVVELADGVDGEGGRLFLVEGAETGVVLRAGLAQADVSLDHLYDVGLLLDGLGEV